MGFLLGSQNNNEGDNNYVFGSKANTPKPVVKKIVVEKPKPVVVEEKPKPKEEIPSTSSGGLVHKTSSRAMMKRGKNRHVPFGVYMYYIPPDRTPDFCRL